MRRGHCVRAVGESWSEEVTFEQRPEQGSHVGDIWRRVFLVKGRASANVLR